MFFLCLHRTSLGALDSSYPLRFIGDCKLYIDVNVSVRLYVPALRWTGDLGFTPSLVR